MILKEKKRLIFLIHVGDLTFYFLDNGGGTCHAFAWKFTGRGV